MSNNVDNTSMDSANEIIEITDVEVIETNEVIKNSEVAIKAIQPYSFPLDNHLAELPMFLNYSYNKDKIDNINIEEHPSLKQLSNINDIINNNGIERKVFSNEKNNTTRKLFMYNVGKLPRQFEQDVLDALIVLFTQKNSPFIFGEDGKYNIHTDKVMFTFYELCDVLKVAKNGFYINKIKDAIRVLKSTQYFSFDDGVFYDQEKKSYVISKERGISWIADYNFLSAKSTKNMKTKDLNWVQFGNFMIHNLEYGYFNYISSHLDIFFKLSSGFTRQIYSYIDKNMFDSNGKKLKYIKRFFDTLQFKFGLNYEYSSHLKRRLNKPLNELVKEGLIADYFYGDETLINGIKEDCLYICSVKKEKVIEDLEKSFKKKIQQIGFFDENEDVKKHVDYLKLPKKELYLELMDIGFDEENARMFVSRYDKWTIIKYLIWINKQLSEGKEIPKQAGLFRVAISKGYKLKEDMDILDFIEKEQNKSEDNSKKKIMTIDEEYENYVQSCIDELRTQETDVFNLLYETVLNDLLDNINEQMAKLKKVKGDTKKLDDFIKNKDKSELFKEAFLRDIKMYKNIKSLEEFKYERLNTKSE